MTPPALPRARRPWRLLAQAVALVCVAYVLWALWRRPPAAADWRKRFAEGAESLRRTPRRAAPAAGASPGIAQRLDSGAPPAPIAAADFAVEWMAATCRRAARCGTWTTDLALCVGLHQSYVPVTVEPTVRAMRDGEVIYDGADAARLLAQDEDAPCAKSGQAWKQAFTGRRHQGESCWSDISCERPLSCRGARYGFARVLQRLTYHRPGVCDVAVAEPAKRAGDACSGEWSCGEALACADGTCQTRRGPGAACRGHRDCADDLRCLGHTCAQTPQEGQRCEPGDGESCEWGLACWRDGLCRHLVDVGEACDRGARDQISSGGCRNGLACIATGPGARCLPSRGEGEGCEDSGDCESGSCVGQPGHRICEDSFYNPMVPHWLRDRVDDVVRPFYEW